MNDILTRIFYRFSENSCRTTNIGCFSYTWSALFDANTCFCPMCFHREHLIRLQHENKMLKLAQEGSDNEKIALLQSLLEDANRRKNELETENRSAKSTETRSPAANFTGLGKTQLHFSHLCSISY